MLEIIQISSRAEIKNYLDRMDPFLDPFSTTWLVSDLRSKKDLQNIFIEKNSHFIDESVLRASDLWQVLFKRNELSLRIVSDAFAKSLLKNILDKNAEVLGINGTSEKSMLGYLKVLAPILFHADGSSVMQEWFGERPESANRWKAWFLRSKLCADLLTHQDKVILRDWVVPYLLENYSERLKWDKKLFVDLGGNISQSEAELLRVLSRNTDVVVFCPEPSWMASFEYLLKPYSYLKSQASGKTKQIQQIEPDISDSNVKSSNRVYRFSGALAEVKHAVAKVREWILQGKDPSKICVSSPDIEKYWPCLSSYLEKEGIPYQKDQVIKIQSLLDVKTWLSKIRSLGSQPSYEDLELSYYNQSSNLIRFELFASLYKNIYSDSDLCRNSEIEKVYYRKIDYRRPLSAEEFIAEILKFWTGTQHEAISTIATEIHKNASPKHLLGWSIWIGYVETIASQKEILIQKGHPGGITVDSLASVQSWNLENRIFIGLEDEALRSSTATHIDPADILSISSLYGFYLENPEQSHLEFEIRWLTPPNFKGQTEFVFANTDFNGGLQTVSKVWLEYLMNEGRLADFEKIEIPDRTRWDSLQDHFLMGEGHLSFSKVRLEIDLGKTEMPKIASPALGRISPSSLDRWHECPFLVACDQIFNLQRYPDVDLDLDAMTKGKIYHYLFFRLTENPFNDDISVDQINQILEDFKKENQQNFVSQEFWDSAKKKYIDLGIRFLNYEKKLREDFKLLKTIGRESELSFYVIPEEPRAAKNYEEGSIRVSGRIDRIDSDEAGNIAVVDYKSSLSSKHSPTKWIEDRNFQLLLYGWAIENNFVEGIRGSIAGLFFQSVKTFERKGYRDDESIGHLFYPASGNKKAKSLTKEELFSEFSKYLNEVALALKNGTYAPKPSDKKNCVTCDYRGLCRASHLI